jgi:hypothetical protein
VLKLLPHNLLLIQWVQIEGGGDFSIISPVKRCHLNVFQLLLNQLQESWQNNLENLNFWEQTGIELGDRIMSFLSKVDIDTQTFKCAVLPHHELEELFIGRIRDEKVQPCYLIALHSFDVKPVPPRKEGENITPADVPIPSSGNDDADLFARLIAVDESVEGAWLLWRQFDAGFLHSLIEQINELRRDPDERVKEYIAAQFKDWKQQNQDVYKQALGLI